MFFHFWETASRFQQGYYIVSIQRIGLNSPSSSVLVNPYLGKEAEKRCSVAECVTQITTLVMDCFYKRVSVYVDDCVFVLLMGV